MMFKRIKTQTLVNNPWVLLVVAVVAAGLLTWWIYQYLTGREAAMRQSLLDSMNANQVSVMVPVRDLQPGAVINSSNFAAREVSADFVYDDTIRSSAFDSVANLTLVRPVKRGSPVRRADVSALQARDFSDMLKPGTRALTIDIDSINSADNMLKPGNRIDLFLIASPPTDKSNTTSSDSQSAHLLLSDLDVLATGQDVRARDYGEELSQQDARQPGGYDSLTLQVTPDQAARIALAQKVGTLRAVLRNRADKKATPDVNVKEASLFGDSESGGIQYIIGGSRENTISMRPNLDTRPPGVIRAAASANQTTNQKIAALTDAQARVMQQIQSAMSGNGVR